MPGPARYAMTIDLAACVGCAACAVACRVENEVPLGFDRVWIRERESGTFPELRVEFRPEACQHCQDPACVRACPTGASYRNAGGVVLVDAARCIACGACIAACPYDARFMHPDGHADKCTFCWHRVAVGRDPACVETCPTGARAFGDLLDARSPASRAIRHAQRIDVLNPGAGTGPNVYYLNSPIPTGLEGEVRE